MSLIKKCAPRLSVNVYRQPSSRPLFTFPSLLAICTIFCAVALGQSVSVNFSSSRATVPPYGQGIGTAVYDGDLMDSAVPTLVKNAGYNIWRYPGGSYADIYHWQTNTATGGAYVNSSDTFDNFMSQVRSAGGTAIITANYSSNAAGNGGGDPNEAAAWVTYANQTKGYGVKYWEIGNEVYGNGFYGSQWEEDLHADKSPTAYGNNFLAFASAMKAQDSTIKVGAVLTTPGNWPDGVSPDWTSTVLPIVCPAVDFVIFHWYPSTNPLFAPENELLTIAPTIRSRVNQYCPSRSSSIEIWLTEGNWDGTQTPGALFAADQWPAWWENGVNSMDWQILHNGIYLVNGVNEDSGVLSNASCSGSTCEPAADTPFPAYYGAQMVHDFTSPGDTLLSATSSSTNVAVHAAKNSSGRFALMLINKTSGTLSVPVSVSGTTTVGSSGTKFFYGASSTSVSQSSISGLGSSFTISLPANSITDIVTTASSGSSTPSISSLSPTSGAAGSSVTISGSNFGSSQGSSTVKFGSTTATATSWSATSIHANVPSISAGTVSVTVTVSGVASNGVSFTVTTSGNLVANGTYTFTNRNSGLVMDDPGFSTTPGQQIEQWSSNGGNNQKWQLTNLGSNNVQLICVSSGLALDMSGSSKSNGGQVIQWTPTGASNQIWHIAVTSGGFYEITNQNSGLAMEVPGSSTSNGTFLDQSTYTGGNNQQWSIH